jgi:hypothetical protein
MKGDKRYAEFVAAMTKLRTMALRVHADGVRKLHIGIDPGAEGALGFVVVEGGKVWRATVLDIPTFQEKRSGSTKSKVKTKTSFDLDGILEVFAVFGKLNPYQVHVMLEQPPPSMGPGRKYAEILLNKAYALWPLFLAAKGYQVKEVAPSVWKDKMGVDRADKGIALRRARILFAGEVVLDRVGDHNRAEALLLAEYSRRVVHGI